MVKKANRIHKEQKYDYSHESIAKLEGGMSTGERKREGKESTALNREINLSHNHNLNPNHPYLCPSKPPVMNVFLRIIKMVLIAALIILNENKDQLLKSLGITSYLVGAIIGFLLFFLIAELVKDLLLYLYRKRKNMKPGQTDNVTYGLENIYILFLAGALFYSVLYMFKLKPREFFTGFTLISAATAIVMKDYVSNIISGMILAFSDKLKIGDYVRIGKHTGEILNFSLSMITMRNDDDELVYLPINLIFTTDFINYSPGQEDFITVPFEINHKMRVPFDDLEKRISETLATFHPNIQPGSGQLKVTANNQETTSFKYQYVLKTPDILLARRIKEVILKTVFETISLPKAG